MIPPEIIGLIGVGLLLALLVTGMPIAMGAMLAGFLGIWYLAGIEPALVTLGTAPFSRAATYVFLIIPLFVLMGYVAFEAGLAKNAFETAKRWLGHIPGGVAMAVIAGNAAFGACSGSSIAATATMGKISLPEMERLNYSPRLAAGVIAATGTFASMIPPSGMLVVYAIMSEVSVGQMLLAGLIPGFITAVLYAALLYLRIKRNPSIAGGIMASSSWRERFRSLPQIWAVGVIAVVIIGGIYTGIFTPIEAAGISAFVSLILLLIRKRLKSWASFKEALLSTGKTTAMIFFLIVGFVIFAHFVALSRLPSSIMDWIFALGLNRYIVLALIIVVYILLGMVMDALGILLVTLSVTLPIITTLGFDPIWFGVIIVKLCEIGAVTPPVGINVYVVKGIAPNIPMGDVFWGALPFVIADVACLVLLIALPQIVLFLPNTML